MEVMCSAICVEVYELVNSSENLATLEIVFFVKNKSDRRKVRVLS